MAGYKRNEAGWNQSTQADITCEKVAPQSHHPFGKGFSNEHQSTQTSKSTSPKNSRGNFQKGKGGPVDFEKNSTQALKPPGFGTPNRPEALPPAWRGKR